MWRVHAILAALGAICLLIAPRASAQVETSGTAPVLVYRELNPWAAVIGAESPRFALYANGTVIYRTYNRFRSARLGPDAMIALLELIREAEPASGPRYFELTLATDQPSHVISVFDDDGCRNVIVYGSPNDFNVQGVLPDSFRNLLSHLRSFEDPTAQDWVPDRFEVMLVPYKNATKASIVWPADLPDLDDPATMRRTEGQFSLFVPATEFRRVANMLADQPDGRALLVSGRKWSASYRFPFPDEQSWLAPGICR